MCGRHRKYEEVSNERVEKPAGAYEGETVRLGTYQPVQSVQRKQFHFHGGFPWWTLWLIWPLFGVIKGVFGALGATATTLFASLPTFAISTSAIWPIALIVIGLLILRRR